MGHSCIKSSQIPVIMRPLFTLLFCATGLLSVFAEQTPAPNMEWVNHPFCSQFSEFKSITIYPHPSDKTILAAYYVDGVEDKYTMRVCKLDGDKIEWGLVPEYIGRARQPISCRWVSLGILENTILEIVTKSDSGTRELSLFELNGRFLQLILHTVVPVQSPKRMPEFEIPRGGKATFSGDQLAVNYRKKPGEKFETVFLTGSVSITDIDGKEFPSKPYYQECTWDEERHVFVVQPATSKKTEK